MQKEHWAPDWRFFRHCRDERILQCKVNNVFLWEAAAASSIMALKPAALITAHLGGNAVTLRLHSLKTSLPFTGCWDPWAEMVFHLLISGASFRSSYPLLPVSLQGALLSACPVKYWRLYRIFFFQPNSGRGCWIQILIFFFLLDTW